MKSIPWRHIFAALIAAFFVLGGTMNIFASEQIQADYTRWGYPGWFHYLTGILEWTAAVLIALPATRLIGSLLAAGVMASAAGTVLLNGEFSHAIAPLIVLVIVAINFWVTWRANNRLAAPA